LVAWFQTQLCSWNQCGWSLGSISDVCALSIWALAGIMIVCHYPQMRLDATAVSITGSKGSASPTSSTHSSSSPQTKSLDDEPTAMVVSHHSYDDDEELDERRYPDAEMA